MILNGKSLKKSIQIWTELKKMRLIFYPKRSLETHVHKLHQIQLYQPIRLLPWAEE